MSDAAAWTDAPFRTARLRMPLGTAISLALHGLLLAAALWVSPLRALVVPPPSAVTVEIVTPDQFAALSGNPSPVAANPPTPVAAPAPENGAEPSDRLPTGEPVQPKAVETTTHRATQFYAAGILKEPGMARIKKTLETFAPSERLVQLCNIEGLEQIRRAEPKYAPDTLVSYAMSDPIQTGLTLTASGAAMRSRRKWYGLSLTCTVAADYGAVSAFSFKMGEPIPEDQWEAHNLNAEDASE